MENTAIEVMGMRRTEAGLLDNGADINKSMTPFDIYDREKRLPQGLAVAE